jgi:hypothetical protein
MGFGFFQGSKIKILKPILSLNGEAEIDGSAISASKVMISDGDKSVKSSTVTTTELDYLIGTTAAIQGQINAVAAGVLPAGNITVSGNLGVTGTTSLTGSLTAAAITGTSLTINGNETVTGTLNVTGLSTLGSINSPAVTAGAFTATGNVLVQNELRLEDPDSGINYVALKASTTQAADHTYTLPSSLPVSDGQAMVSTTAGTMSWTSVAVAGTYDVPNTTFTVSASLTNTIITLNAAINSAHIFWSLHNGVADAHQAGNSVAIKKNSSYELINTIAGSATFGDVNLTITSGGAIQLDTPSVSGTMYYRILTT